MLSHLRSHPRLRDDRSHRPCNARICRTTHIDRRKHHRHACTWWYERPQRRICPPLYPSKRDIKHRCSRTPQHLDEFGIRGDRPRGPHHDRGLLRHLVTGLHHPGDRLPTGTQGYPRHAQLHRRQQPPVRSNGLSSRHRGSRSIVVYGIQPAMVVQASLHRTAERTRIVPRERVRYQPGTGTGLRHAHGSRSGIRHHARPGTGLWPRHATPRRNLSGTEQPGLLTRNMSVPRTHRRGAHSCSLARITQRRDAPGPHRRRREQPRTHPRYRDPWNRRSRRRVPQP